MINALSTGFLTRWPPISLKSMLIISTDSLGKRAKCLINGCVIVSRTFSGIGKLLKLFNAAKGKGLLLLRLCLKLILKKSFLRSSSRFIANT